MVHLVNFLAAAAGALTRATGSGIIRPWGVAAGLCLAGLCSVACGTGLQANTGAEGEVGPADTKREGDPVVLEPVSYHRTGGIVGTDDRITVSPDGQIQVSGRLLGRRSGQLSAAQMADLAAALEGWEELESEYPAPPGAADFFEVTISYGDAVVIASDAARDVPEQFHRARELLESLARSLSEP